MLEPPAKTLSGIFPPAGIASGMQTVGFSADELNGIDRVNAAQLFPKYA